MYPSRAVERPSARPLVYGGLAIRLRDLLGSAIRDHGADFGNIQLFDPASGALTIVASQGFDAQFLDYFRVVKDTHSACWRALQSGGVCAVSDVELDVEFAPHRAAAKRAGFRSVRSEALVGSKGERLGVLSTHFRTPDGPSRVASEAQSVSVRLAATMIEEHLRTNERSVPVKSPAAAAELLRTTFEAGAKVERARVNRELAQMALSSPKTSFPENHRRPIPSSDLTDATVAYVRAIRADGASPESMLAQVKRTLGASDSEHVLDRDLISAVISVAILAYYAESRSER